MTIPTDAQVNEQLTRALANTGLAPPPQLKATTHLIKLRFPACELLSEKVKPLLAQPSRIEQRIAPPLNHADAGVFDSSFFARMPLQIKHSFAEVMRGGSQLTQLLTAVDTVFQAPGVSVLLLVSFVDPQTGDTKHRIRLHGEREQSPQDFELYDEQWSQLLKEDARQIWIRLLRQLVSRRSARAYYHVRARLVEAYGEEAAMDEQYQWWHLWGTNPARGVKELLCQRLFKGNQDAMDRFRASGDSRQLAVPDCGHPQEIRKIALVSLPKDACVRYKCTTCDKRVLQQADNDEMMYQTEVQRAKVYVELERDWRLLATDIEEDGEVLHIPTAVVSAAIGPARESMKQPSHICPPGLSFYGFHEVVSASFKIEDSLNKETLRLISLTRKQMFFALYDGVQQVMAVHDDDDSPYPERVLPPGFWDGVRIWITRAVRLVADRACANQEH